MNTVDLCLAILMGVLAGIPAGWWTMKRWMTDKSREYYEKQSGPTRPNPIMTVTGSQVQTLRESEISIYKEGTHWFAKASFEGQNLCLRSVEVYSAEHTVASLGRKMVEELRMRREAKELSDMENR